MRAAVFHEEFRWKAELFSFDRLSGVPRGEKRGSIRFVLDESEFWCYIARWLYRAMILQEFSFGWLVLSRKCTGWPLDG